MLVKLMNIKCGECLVDLGGVIRVAQWYVFFFKRHLSKYFATPSFCSLFICIFVKFQLFNWYCECLWQTVFFFVCFFFFFFILKEAETELKKRKKEKVSGNLMENFNAGFNGIVYFNGKFLALIIWGMMEDIKLPFFPS